jgi:hypothetical protein
MFVVGRDCAALSPVIVRLDRTIQYSRDISDQIGRPLDTLAPSLRGATATKQSSLLTVARLDCFAGARNDGDAEMTAIGTMSRGVLDTRFRGYDGGGWAALLPRHREER